MRDDVKAQEVVPAGNVEMKDPEVESVPINEELKEMLEKDEQVGKPIVVVALITIFVLAVSLIRGGKSDCKEVIGS